MTLDALIRKVAEVRGERIDQTRPLVEEVFEQIARALAAGEKVSLYRFGAFHLVRRRARRVLHPRSKVPIRLRAGVSVGFRAGDTLKRRVKRAPR